MEKVFVGLNLSHDSSVAVLSSQGEIIFALSEERLSRVKNFTGFPRRALREAINFVESGTQIDVVVGSHSTFPLGERTYFSWIFDRPSRPSFDWISGTFNAPPGFTQLNSIKMISNSVGLRNWVETRIRLEFEAINRKVTGVTFQNHHKSHLVTGFAGSGFENGLAFSLDAEGDGHSGAVLDFISNDGLYETQKLLTIPVNSSLGYFYSAVTKRYNFKPGQHEGKITGLAAYGSHSEAVSFLSNVISVANETIRTGVPNSRYLRAVRSAVHRITNSSKVFGTFDEMVGIAESKTINYEDLAFAAQHILEKVVEDLVLTCVNRNEKDSITLSGGVFSNVKLNQRIAELSEVKRLFIFPSMGDAGLSVGGIWQHLLGEKKLSTKPKFNSMYLGNSIRESIPQEELQTLVGIECRKLDQSSIISLTVDALSRGKIVGLVQGREEFGPRALMNRSILANPVDKELNSLLNSRLNRTEFMPFAPVCREEDLEEVFELPALENLSPWSYMTITCQVREKWRQAIGAVVHVDGTARPQSVNRMSNPFGHALIGEFYKKTGIPVLVNTSFNVHEEPIISTIEDGLRALRSSRIDLLITPSVIFTTSQ